MDNAETVKTMNDLNRDIDALIIKYSSGPLGAQSTLLGAIHYIVSGFFFSINEGQENEAETYLGRLIADAKYMSNCKKKELAESLKGLFKKGET